jgi:hypothetical protein
MDLLWAAGLGLPGTMAVLRSSDATHGSLSGSNEAWIVSGHRYSDKLVTNGVSEEQHIT